MSGEDISQSMAPALSPQCLRNWVQETSSSWLTPAYLYDAGALKGRVRWLQQRLGGLLDLSFAIKSNPNPAILERMKDWVPYFDASSWAEVHRALDAGKPADHITYSGPGKRPAELAAAVAAGVAVVVESREEIDEIDALARERGLIHPVLLRINPDYVPRGFGASMSGKPSQFGIDEAEAQAAVAAIDAAASMRLSGLHIYTGSNALVSTPIVENFHNMARIFRALTNDGQRPLDKLIFGSGFGIPYHAGQEPLDVDAVIEGISADISALRACPGFAQTRFLLELGRWLVGPTGALVTRVLSVKSSRGQTIAVCDAGFNNHLAACGMMGATFRKDYPIVALTEGETAGDIKLTGPLCTSIDTLAGPLPMPALKRGDAIAIMQSGAYGLTASPTRFISHPDPLELLCEGGQWTDITEVHLNHVIDR